MYLKASNTLNLVMLANSYKIAKIWQGNMYSLKTASINC